MKEFECRKCGIVDNDGMYSNAIGGWLCDNHYNELESIINKFMESIDERGKDISQ